jgi:hypothetical protein
MGWLALSLLLAFSGCGGSSGGHTATVAFNKPWRNTPQRTDTRLHLVAGGVSSCDDGNRSIDGVNVRETSTEVLVRAEIRTGGGSMFCEERDFEVPFAVTLHRPLGQRTVIDSSRGAAIWSPAINAKLVQAEGVRPSQAEALLRSKVGPGPDIRCSPGRSRFFGCEVKAPSRAKPTLVYVLKQPGGGLKPTAAETLPPELRTCKDVPGKPADVGIC